MATGEVERGLEELREAFEEAMRSSLPNAMAACVNLGYWTWWVEGPAAGARLFDVKIGDIVPEVIEKARKYVDARTTNQERNV